MGEACSNFRWALALGVSLSLLVCARPSGSAPAAAPPVTDLLRSVGFTAAEISAVERGIPVARALDSDRREIAVIGAVRIKAARQRLAERFRTIDYMKGSRMILGAGAFSTPPRSEDLAAVPFEPYDLDVRDCRPGDCRVRLSSDDINRFQREVDWRSTTWASQSAHVWRQVLSGYAQGYFRYGIAALPVFANKSEPLSVADETSLLMRQFTFVSSLWPDLLARVQVPVVRAADSPAQILFWSKEDFGVRPVLRIIHQSIHWAGVQGTDHAARPLIVSTTQLYANHYLDAAVGFVVAVDDQAADPSSGFHMIMVNRVRTRSLTGFLRALIRSTVQGRSRDAMESVLRTTKSSLGTTKQ
jgi:hypothetical protein